jgi:hypothetical protein
MAAQTQLLAQRRDFDRSLLELVRRGFDLGRESDVSWESIAGMYEQGTRRRSLSGSQGGRMDTPTITDITSEIDDRRPPAPEGGAPPPRGAQVHGSLYRSFELRTHVVM